LENRRKGKEKNDMKRVNRDRNLVWLLGILMLDGANKHGDVAKQDRRGQINNKHVGMLARHREGLPGTGSIRCVIKDALEGDSRGDYGE
jgi:hypothetical protein